MYGQAIAAYARVSADNTQALAFMVNACARSGRRAEALRALDELKRIARAKGVPSHQFAIAYAGLGAGDEARAWLEKAYLERSDWLVWLNRHPAFDPLRWDPRFRDLVRRVGLSPRLRAGPARARARRRRSGHRLAAAIEQTFRSLAPRSGASSPPRPPGARRAPW